LAAGQELLADGISNIILNFYSFRPFNPFLYTFGFRSRIDKLRAITALDLLFPSYLHYQLGFDDETITQKGDPSHSLAKVYQNLTLDPNEPLPLFASLLNNKWPAPESFPVGVDTDNPWPLPPSPSSSSKTRSVKTM
jgi:hypothetical protein